MIITLAADRGGRHRRVSIFKDEVEGLLHTCGRHFTLSRLPSASTYEQQLAAAACRRRPLSCTIGLMQVFTEPQACDHALAMGGQEVPIRLRRSLSGPLPGLRREGGLLRHRAHAFTGTCSWAPRADRRRAHHLLGDRAGGDGNLSVVAATSEPGVGRMAAAIAGKALWCCSTCTPSVGFYIAVVAIVISLTGLIYTYVWGIGYRYAAAEDRGLRLNYETQALQIKRPKPKTCPSTESSRCAAEDARQQSCASVSSSIAEGNYLVTAASGNLDGGDPYELPDLVAFGGKNIIVAISQDRPGVYTMNEVTAGIWPLFYSGRANPELKVDVCGNTITGREGYSTAGAGTVAARTFTLNGTVNDDSTIDMSWSYVRDDGTTPVDPAQGSYTLTLIKVGM